MQDFYILSLFWLGRGSDNPYWAWLFECINRPLITRLIANLPFSLGTHAELNLQRKRDIKNMKHTGLNNILLRFWYNYIYFLWLTTSDKGEFCNNFSFLVKISSTKFPFNFWVNQIRKLLCFEWKVSCQWYTVKI